MCWKQIGGGALKFAAWTQGYRLDFSDIHVGIRFLLFEDFVLYDVKEGGSTFALRSEKMTLAWPLQIKMEKPFLSLTKKVEFLGGEKSRAVVDISEGHLNWMDGAFPSCRFSFYRNEEGSAAFRLERDLRNHSVGGHVDVQYTAGRIESIDLHVEGRDVALEHGGYMVSGSFEIEWLAHELELAKDWDWRKILEATQRGRCEFANGAIAHGESAIRNLGAAATFQTGLGGKWEGIAVAEAGSIALPFSFEAKAALKLAREGWIQADFKLGEMGGTIGDHPWNIRWERLGPQEARFLQEFAGYFTEWSWIKGVADGALAWVDGPILSHLNVEDLELAQGDFSFGCDRAWYRETGELMGGWLAMDGARRAIDWTGSWTGAQQKVSLQGTVDGLTTRLSLSKKGGLWETECSLSDLFQAKGLLSYADRIVDLHQFSGDVRGIAFEGMGICSLDGTFDFSIPKFSGAVTSWHASFLPGIQLEGRIDSIESGLQLRGIWDRKVEWDDWSLACSFYEGHAPLTSIVTLHDVSLDLHADTMSWDLSPVRGISHFTMADRTIEIPFEASRIYLEGDHALFDVRCQRKTWDFIRFAGEKQGNRIVFDTDRSQVLGESVSMGDWHWQDGKFSVASIETTLSLPLLRSLVEEWGWSADLPLEGSLLVKGLYEEGETFQFSLTGTNTVWAERPFPIDFKMKQEKASLAIGPFQATGEISLYDDEIWINQGSGHLYGTAFSFEGKLTSALKGEFNLLHCLADVEQGAQLGFGSSGWKGSLEGLGYIRLGLEGLEADLDLNPAELEWQGFSFQNKGPLQLFLSTSKGAVLKGIDCSIAKDGLLVHGKADLCQFDRNRRHWALEKTHLYLPADLLAKASLPGASVFDPGKEVDVIAEIDCAYDFSHFACEIKEGLFPIGGAVRHLRDLHLFFDSRRCIGDCLFSHQGKVAKISVEVDIEPTLEGRCLFENAENEVEHPLLVDWTYDGQHLTIQEIDGSFAGIEASFHGQSVNAVSQLIGTARVDFTELSAWIPPQVAEVFQEIKMGAGYELKGHLSIDQIHWGDIQFKGIFSGKQIELFGYELRTLLGQAELSPTNIHLYDLKISDNAGILKIDDLTIGSKNKEPWTIAIPKLTIQDLRPSLLHSPNEEPGQLTPLLIRKLTLSDFKGLLDEGKTYTAQGELTFVNSFKRGETLLDYPANIFDRIVGLDLDLLIPVIGNLNFHLKDGFFSLDELKDSYSDGKRSEFFLVRSATSPRMDLKGNLQILVQMKQFVLFKFTDAFMISIEGKLNHPQFRLQKKKRLFSSIYD